MKYVIAGKSDSFNTYAENRKDIVYAKNKHIFSQIKETDTIVLLNGWWMRTWAEEHIKQIMKIYPTIKFEYMDGPFGEEKRKKLKSEKISNRFKILDI